MGIASRLERRSKLAGGAIISRMLAAEGVDTVFGIIDGTYMGMYSAFGGDGINLITPRHETSGVHMAGAYARLTGKLGVVIASNGPGVANALPGVAVEEAEGNRVLLITSSRRHGIVHPDRGGTFQCFPQVQVIGAMSKWSAAVPSGDRVAELLRRALRACYTGRPGVVHLEVPEDVMNGTLEEDPAWFRPVAQYRPTEPLTPSESQVRRALDLLAAARKPLIHVGSGVIHAGCYDAVRRFAEQHEAALTTSWAARAAIDERDPRAVPMWAVDAVRRARNDADLVLVLGSRLGETDFWGKAPYWATPDKQKLIQVDLDLEHLGNNRPVELAVQADVGAFLDAALAAPSGAGADLAGRRKWLEALGKDASARRRQMDKHLTKDGSPMHPARIPTATQAVLDDDAIVVIDGGNTSIWSHFFHEVRVPNTLLGTPKMGMLGAGVAQALGAKAACPDRQVICLIGDGAFGFHPQEVETAVRAGLQVVWIVFCDRQWGMVKINQHFALRPVKTLIKKTLPAEECINTDLGEIRFDDLARSMGAHGERVASPADLPAALERALASGKPAVIHADVDRVAHLWAPNLRTFKDMHQEPAGR
ncbi:MAG: thiamine pyrophosphate-binding protein [Myxococcota bacterium]|jgi:acetolactate synthase-1/2/3 large subunit|nr:thiamine pyrophosphate-binding protein [Myxococcota bacterium]